MINKKGKKVCTTLRYIEHVLGLVSTTAGFVSISAFVWSSNRNCEFHNRTQFAQYLQEFRFFCLNIMAQYNTYINLKLSNLQFKISIKCVN